MRESARLTTVELVFYRERTERWLRFGRDVGERLLDRRRRLILFAAESVFAFVRWEGNDHGTVLSRIVILRACRAGEAMSTVPGISPAARSCCGSPVGPGSSGCSTSLRRSKVPASIQ
jgi:hypothetical protein